jgi:hypothetical protein
MRYFFVIAFLLCSFVQAQDVEIATEAGGGTVTTDSDGGVSVSSDAGGSTVTTGSDGGVSISTDVGGSTVTTGND